MAITRKSMSKIHRAAGDTISVSDSAGNRVNFKRNSEAKYPLNSGLGLQTIARIVNKTKKAFKQSSSQGKDTLKQMLIKHAYEVYPLQLYSSLQKQKLGRRLLPYLDLLQKGHVWMVSLECNRGSAVRALKRSSLKAPLPAKKKQEAAQVMTTIMEEGDVIDLDSMNYFGKRVRTPAKSNANMLNWEDYGEEIWIAAGGNTY